MADASISITAPSNAKEGENVPASVLVTNITEFHYSFKGDIFAVPDLYPDYVIGTVDEVIESGVTKTYNVSFTMPDCNATVFIWLERWAFDHWAYVGSASKVVSLELAPVPTEWVPLTEVRINVTVPEIAVGWYELYNTSVQVTVPEIPVGWYELYNTIVPVTVPEIPVGWYELYSAPIQVSVPVPPEEEEEFPWIPVALIGGGVVLAAATMIPKKTKT